MGRLENGMSVFGRDNFEVEAFEDLDLDATPETFTVFVPTDMSNVSRFLDDYDYDMEASHNTFFWDELLPTLIVYCLTFVLGLVGNFLIIFTISRYRKMKSTTNVFLASLASSDLLLILFCIPVKGFHTFIPPKPRKTIQQPASAYRKLKTVVGSILIKEDEEEQEEKFFPRDEPTNFFYHSSSESSVQPSESPYEPTSSSVRPGDSPSSFLPDTASEKFAFMEKNLVRSQPPNSELEGLMTKLSEEIKKCSSFIKKLNMASIKKHLTSSASDSQIEMLSGDKQKWNKRSPKVDKPVESKPETVEKSTSMYSSTYPLGTQTSIPKIDNRDVCCEDCKYLNKRIIKLERELEKIEKRMPFYSAADQTFIRDCLERLKATSETVLEKLKSCAKIKFDDHQEKNSTRMKKSTSAPDITGQDLILKSSNSNFKSKTDATPKRFKDEETVTDIWTGMMYKNKDASCSTSQTTEVYLQFEKLPKANAESNMESDEPSKKSEETYYKLNSPDSKPSSERTRTTEQLHNSEETSVTYSRRKIPEEELTVEKDKTEEPKHDSKEPNPKKKFRSRIPTRRKETPSSCSSQVDSLSRSGSGSSFTEPSSGCSSKQHVMLAKLFSFTWTFGFFLCKLVHYMQSVSAICSVLTLTAMSLERYYAIVHPMKAQYICTISQARRIITGTWISAFLLAVPILFAQVHLRVGVKVEAYWCVRDWDNKTIWRAHELYMMLLILVVPTGVMAVAYTAICWEIWEVIQRRQDMTSGKGHETCRKIRYPRNSSNESFPSSVYGNNSTRMDKRRGRGFLKKDLADDGSSVKQVIKMLVAVVVIYVLCWGPMLIDNVLQAYGILSHIRIGWLKYMGTTFHLMAYFNSCINPIIYGFMSKNFRESFRKTLCCGGKKPKTALRNFSISQTRNTSIRYAESSFGRTVSIALPV